MRSIVWRYMRQKARLVNTSVYQVNCYKKSIHIKLDNVSERHFQKFPTFFLEKEYTWRYIKIRKIWNTKTKHKKWDMCVYSAHFSSILRKILTHIDIIRWIAKYNCDENDSYRNWDMKITVKLCNLAELETVSFFQNKILTLVFVIHDVRAWMENLRM